MSNEAKLCVLNSEHKNHNVSCLGFATTSCPSRDCVGMENPFVSIAFTEREFID